MILTSDTFILTSVTQDNAYCKVRVNLQYDISKKHNFSHNRQILHDLKEKHSFLCVGFIRNLLKINPYWQDFKIVNALCYISYFYMQNIMLFNIFHIKMLYCNNLS